MTQATKGGNFNSVPLPEPQTAFARCYSVIDIGTVPVFFKGEAKGKQRKIYITWEFPGLLATFNPDKGEQPFVIGMELTAVTGDKSNLSKLVSSWRNRPLDEKEEESFDPAVMIGKPCFISFIHKRKKDYIGKEVSVATNANTNLKFNGIMPVPKNVEALPVVNAYYNWDWDKIATNGFDKDLFEKMPKWLQKKAATSDEFRKYAGGYKIEGSDEPDSLGPEPSSDQPATGKTVEGNW
jgi:hypothetical protein